MKLKQQLKVEGKACLKILGDFLDSDIFMSIITMLGLCIILATLVILVEFFKILYDFGAWYVLYLLFLIPIAIGWIAFKKQYQRELDDLERDQRQDQWQKEMAWGTSSQAFTLPPALQQESLPDSL